MRHKSLHLFPWNPPTSPRAPPDCLIASCRYEGLKCMSYSWCLFVHNSRQTLMSPNGCIVSLRTHTYATHTHINFDTHKHKTHPCCPAQKKEAWPSRHIAAYLNNLSLQCRKKGKKREERRREKEESIKGHYASVQPGYRGGVCGDRYGCGWMMCEVADNLQKRCRE